ncbi:hypothetical protein [Bradyrhizobium sp. STM 3809]|uniref:hypothetical protein n=1 Tax=Bradyrhizobium sp. STM 3809 TaxID=551936 RepID=UPI00054D8A71|nr:hypothetical protein [Bradyrhizobium sp. STM 3809]
MADNAHRAEIALAAVVTRQFPLRVKDRTATPYTVCVPQRQDMASFREQQMVAAIRACFAPDVMEHRFTRSVVEESATGALR